MDKATANKLSKEIIAELQSLAKKHGLTIENGGGKFDSVSLTMKIKISETEKAKVATENNMKSICSLYNLEEERNGIKLVDFKQRSWKRPFIFLQDGKRYVCDERTIKLYLGKKDA